MGGELIPTGWASPTILHSHCRAPPTTPSLVLAIEFGGGDVLLFAGDAQVGNWLSWQDLKWPDMTGPDLLARTVFYKVGHHGSHNATLREKGLEMMTKLRIAVIPVDQQVAIKMRWGAMPLESLVAALSKQTERNNGQTLRTDIPPQAHDQWRHGDGFVLRDGRLGRTPRIEDTVPGCAY